MHNLRTMPAESGWRSIRKVTILGLLFAPLACGGAVRQTAKEAAPAAVEGAIDTVQKPENRRDLAVVLGDPRIKEAAGELTNAIVGGALDSLTEQERLAKLEALSQAFVQRVGSGLAKTMAAELRPQINAMVAESAEQAMDRVLSEKNEARAAEFATAVSRAAMRGFIEELGASDSSPSGDRIGNLAQRASQGFALGFQDAVQQSAARRDAGSDRQGEVLASIGRAAKTSSDIFSFTGLIVGLLLVALVGALGAAVLYARRYRRQSESKERELRQLLLSHPPA